MTTTGFNIKEYIEILVTQYKYKKLPHKKSLEVRKLYDAYLPYGLSVSGDEHFEVKSKKQTIIARGYKSIVIGDYGAYLEIDRKNCFKNNIKCQPGEEYRYKDPQYSSRVKYFWYTANDDSGMKIYFQQRAVDYAGYRPGMMYVSPHDIFIKGWPDE